MTKLKNIKLTEREDLKDHYSGKRLQELEELRDAMQAEEARKAKIIPVVMKYPLASPDELMELLEEEVDDDLGVDANYLLYLKLDVERAIRDGNTDKYPDIRPVEEPILRKASALLGEIRRTLQLLDREASVELKATIDGEKRTIKK